MECRKYYRNKNTPINIPSMKINDKISSDSQTIVNVFNTYFTSVADNFLNNSIEGNNACKKIQCLIYIKHLDSPSQR
jgi:hypothetical protein